MKKEIQIGLLTIITTALVVWGYNFIVGKNLFAKEKTLLAVFHDVTDLAVSSQVIVSGLPVGTVTAIDLNPENVHEIYVTLTVASKIRVPKTASAVLRNQSVMGAKVVELKFDKMCEGANCAQDGDILKAEELGLIGSILNPTELDPYVEMLGPAMDTILNRLGDEGSNDAVSSSVRNLNSTLVNLNSLSANLDRMVAQSSSSLVKLTRNLASLSETLNNSQDQISTMLNNFSLVSEDLSKISLSETMSKTEGTLDQAKNTLEGVEMTMVEAKDAINELSEVLGKVNNSSGTLGKLVNDQELYENLESTSNNLSLLLQDLRLNPKRYLNVSVFGKKSKSYTSPEADPAEVNDK